MVSLDIVPIGQNVYIERITLDGKLKHRLNELGMTNGACIRPVHRWGRNGAIAVEVRGTVIGLRSEAAAEIFVTEMLSED